MSTKTITVGYATETEQFQGSKVATIATGHFVHDSYTSFFPPLLPRFIEVFSLSKTQGGLLSFFLESPSILQPFIGYIADKVSLRYFVILAPTATGVLMSLLGVAPAYWLLAMLLFLTGISSASFHAVAPVMAGRLSGNRLGRGMSFMMVGGELGRTLGSIAIVSVVKFAGVQAAPLLMVVGMLTSVMLYVRLKDVSGRPPNTGQTIHWRQAVKTMSPLLVPLFGVIIAHTIVNSSMGIYLPTFLTEQGFDIWLAGVHLSMYQAAGMVGALTAGSISDRVGRRKVLITAIVGTALFMFAFLSTDGWARVVFIILLGFTTLSFSSVFMAIVQESFPENRALANGIYMAMGFVGRSACVVLLGAIGDFFGLRTSYLVSGTVMILALPLVFLLPLRKTQ